MKKRILLGVLALLLIWIVIVGILGYSAYSEAKQGRSTLTSLSNSDLDTLRTGGEDANLAAASSHLNIAHQRLSSPFLAPLRIVPFVGTQLESGIALTETGATTSAIALDTLQQVRVLSAEPQTDRAALLREVGELCTKNEGRLRGISLGPKDNLITPLRDARVTAVEQLNRVDSALLRGGAASEALAQLLSEPSTYLVIAANNAEMRNGSGMFLQVGLLQTGNGQLSIRDMQSVIPLAVPDNEVFPPGDIEKNWGWLGKRGDFRNLMLSPRYDVSANMAKQIWENNDKPAVSGVLTLDVEMLKALVAVTGPVEAGGKTLTVGNVERELLFNQYQGLGRGGGEANEQRREALSDVASVAFDKFATSNWDVTKGAKELGTAAQGRHLLVWSVDAELNQKWVTAGVGGTLSENSTMLSAVNLGTNKLDQFLIMDSALDVVKSGDATNTTMTIQVTNAAPDDGPAYVLGPVTPDLQEGQYVGMLSLSLPGNATGVKFDGNLPLSLAGGDGPNVAVATGLSVPRGNTQTFVLRYSQPADANGTTIESSARIPGISWTYRGERWKDDAPRNIEYEQ